LPNAIGQALRGDILEHDAFGATCYSGQDLSIGGSGAQKYNLRSKSIRGYTREDIEAVQTGHADIEHSDVRHELPNSLYRGDSTRKVHDQVDVRVRSKNTGHPVKDDRVIVGQNNGNSPPRAVHGNGIRIWSSVPSGELRTSSDPPSSTTRPRSETGPNAATSA